MDMSSEEKQSISEDLKGLICTRPFNNIEYHLSGEAFPCCPSWITKSFGSFKDDSIEEVWNSEEAQDIRRSILDGSYSYCRKDICPSILSKRLSKREDLPENVKNSFVKNENVMSHQPQHVMLVNDDSCNLSCPSCRAEKISHSPGSERFKQIQAEVKKIFNYHIKKNNDYLFLNLTGSGDPFASTVYRQFLFDIDGESLPRLHIDFQTNGVLLTPLMWNNLKNIHKNIDYIWVSIDAAEEATYKTVRRGGNWKVLNENIVFLTNLKKKKKISGVIANMVVQLDNFREMKKFAHQFLDMGCDRINFSLLDDWNTWTRDEFLKRSIHHEDNPYHEEFLQILRDEIFDDRRVWLGNLSAFHTKIHKRYDPGFISKVDRYLLMNIDIHEPIESKNQKKIEISYFNFNIKFRPLEYLWWKLYHCYCIAKGILRNIKNKIWKINE